MNGHRADGDRADKAKQEKDTYSQKHRFKKEFRLLLILVGKYSLHLFSHEVIQCPGIKCISKNTTWGLFVHTFVSYFLV